MSRPFKGKVSTDIRDSVPDWSPFEPPKAPEGAPNVVYAVLDDVGFSAMECYGGPIPTPNIDRIAGNGLRYTQWHTTALCSPTRACLLTGRNHTRNSMACITEAATGFPNASGVIPPENGQIQQILAEQGWNTYMVGKWHLCPEAEMNLASSRRNWPTGRGFERFYGFLGAETNQWYPELVYDSHPVDPPRSPEEGYHLTEDLTDKALEFIKDAKVLAPDKPFFLYYAPGACHAPHHTPRAAKPISALVRDVRIRIGRILYRCAGSTRLGAPRPKSGFESVSMSRARSSSRTSIPGRRCSGYRPRRARSGSRRRRRRCTASSRD